MLALVLASTICASEGHLFACDDATRTPVCYDARKQLLVNCSDLPKDKDGTLRRALWIVAGNGFDVYTTGRGTSQGGVEGNPLLPNVESRVGAKAITAVAEVLLVEVAARVLHKPKLATWIARGLGVGYGLVGLHNLRVGR